MNEHNESESFMGVEVTPQMAQKAETMITKARARLFQRDGFLGHISLGLVPISTNQIEAMGTDGARLVYNPAWIVEQNQNEIMGVLAHEAMHVINKHPLRMRQLCATRKIDEKRNHQAANVAMDLAINPLLLKADFDLPRGALFLSLIHI